MKTEIKAAGNAEGFTLVEILLAIGILGITVYIFMLGQGASFIKTGENNRKLTACHVIDKQIEYQRMTIAMNPDVNYEAFKSLGSTTIVDNTVTPPVTVDWVITPAYDPNNKVIENVRQVDLTASWGSGADDTLKVTTFISRNF